MDDFLTKIYQDEMSKTASIARQEVTDQLGADELEEILGLQKVAVAGPTEAEMPESLPNNELEAQQKAKAEYVRREHEGASKPASKEQTDAQSSNNYQGQSKVAHADRVGRMMAKVAGYKQTDNTQHHYETGMTPLSPLTGAIKGGTTAALLSALGGGAAGGAVGGPRFAAKSALLGALGGGALGAGSGATLSALKRHQVKSDRRQIAKMNKEKNSMGDMEGMEVTAEAKAKIAARLLRITQGAPEEVKTAAIRVAAREMVKEAGIGKMIGSGALGGALGAAAGTAARKQFGKKLVGRTVRGAVGGGLGAAAGHAIRTGKAQRVAANVGSKVKNLLRKVQSQ